MGGASTATGGARKNRPWQKGTAQKKETEKRKQFLRQERRKKRDET